MATEPIDVDYRLSSIFVRGAKLKGDIVEQVTAAEFSLSMDQVTQLTITMEDPDFEVYETGVLAIGTPVDYESLRLSIATMELGPGQAGLGGIRMDCRSRQVETLKKRRGALVMKKASPSQFVERECQAAGIKVVAQPSASRAVISRDVPVAGETTRGAEAPSSWTTFRRLADEIGYVCYEVEGTIYFAQPTWLAKRGDSNPIVCGFFNEPDATRTLSMPTCRHSDDAVNQKTITVELPWFRAEGVYPGRVLQLRGVPKPFAGKYLVKEVAYSLANETTVTVTCEVPENPEPSAEEYKPKTPTKATPVTPTTGKTSPDKKKPATTTPKKTLAGLRGATGDAGLIATEAVVEEDTYVPPVIPVGTSLDFVSGVLSYVKDEVREVIQPWEKGDDDLDGLDLLLLGAQRANVGLPVSIPALYAQMAAEDRLVPVSQALRVRGAVLFTGDPAATVSLSMGNGQVIEGRGREYFVNTGDTKDREYTVGGLIVGLRYPPTVVPEPLVTERQPVMVAPPVKRVSPDKTR